MIPSPCPGLIPCTPIPTPGPVGLTHDEAIRLGTAYGTVAAVLIVVILIALTVALSLAVFIATKE